MLKTLPKTPEYEYRHATVTKAPTELNPGERSDVSWITTESVDRTGEVVRARGMEDQQFQANPLVTLGHAYDLPGPFAGTFGSIDKGGGRLKRCSPSRSSTR